MEAFDRLIIAYTNEKSTARLLPYCPVADEFSDILAKTQISPTDPPVLKALREIEMERIKYFVKEYVLVRLAKLNSNVFLADNLMSGREVAYYRKYIAMLGRNDILADKESRSFEYVGFYCIRDLGSVKIDGEVVEVFEGDFFVASIDDIIEYLIQGHVILV